MRPSEVVRSLAALIPTRRPVYLWGSPGAAKSSFVRTAAVGLKPHTVTAGLPHEPSPRSAASSPALLCPT